MANFGSENDDFVKRAGKFGCCARWQRRILVLGNLFLFCMSIVFIAVPALLIYPPSCKNCPDMNLPGLELLGPAGKALLIVFMAAGCFLLLLAFLGCCGSIRKSRCMLITYATLLFMMLCMEMASIGYAFKKISSEDQLKELFCKHWNLDNYQDAKLKVEKAIGCRCCASDQNIPAKYTPKGYCPAGGTGKIVCTEGKDKCDRPKLDPKMPPASTPDNEMPLAVATTDAEGNIDEAALVPIPADDQIFLSCKQIEENFCLDSAATETVGGVKMIGEWTLAMACDLACWGEFSFFPSKCGATKGSLMINGVEKKGKMCEQDPTPFGYCQSNMDIAYPELGATKCEGDWMDYYIGPDNTEFMDQEVLAAASTCETGEHACFWPVGDMCQEDTFCRPKQVCLETVIEPNWPDDPMIWPVWNSVTEEVVTDAVECSSWTGESWCDWEPNSTCTFAMGSSCINDYMEFDTEGQCEAAVYARRRLSADLESTLPTSNVEERFNNLPEDHPARERFSAWSERRRMADKKNKKKAPKKADDASAPVKAIWCYDAVKNKIKKNFKIIAGVGLVTVLYQIFGTIFACVVARAIKKSRVQKEAAAQIAQNVANAAR